MIEQLPSTTISQISKRLVQLRAEGGATTLGRVLTLVVYTTDAGIEEAIAAANFASREHPMRIIVVAIATSEIVPAWVRPIESPGPDQPAPVPVPATDDRLDAEIRVGRDAGAGDVIVLQPRGAVAAEPGRLVSGLLLADAPVVSWWSDLWPAHTQMTPLDGVAIRRITDSGVFPDPTEHLLSLAQGYRPGDTDLAWSRLTLWRAQLASALDNAPERQFTHVTVSGTPDSSSTLLLGAWLRLQLGVPVKRLALPLGASVAWGIHSVVLHSDDGDTVIERSHGPFAAITQPGHPRLEVPLPRRPRQQCLAEDLRLLTPDPLFGRVLTQGVPRVLADGDPEPYPHDVTRDSEMEENS